MQMKLFSALAATVALAGALGGCTRTDPSTPPTSAVPATDAGDADERVATYVRASFQADADLRGYAVDVSANSGRVTLSGRVPSEMARQDVLARARSVEGVAAIDDRLVIDGSDTPTAGARAAGAPDAASMTTKIQAQFFVSPEVAPWNIDVVTTPGGVVTLRGQVDDAPDRDEAERLARSVEGVTEVDNRLRVAPAPDQAADANQPDPWITAKIQAKYFLDAEVKGRSIDVDTRDGVVSLKGTVESDAQRRQAIAIARNTEGVRTVDDQLSLTSPMPPDRQTDFARAADAVDDAWITTKIQAKFFLDRDIKGSAIDVTTKGGVVTLQGKVGSDTERAAAEQIATETDGVTRVTNQLAVATTAS